MANQLPTWAEETAHLWNAGGHSLFILHGNVFDLFPSKESYGNLKNFITNELFPNRAFLMFYDIADGLTFANKAMQGEFCSWLQDFAETYNVEAKIPRNFVDLMAILRKFIADKRDDATKNGKKGITLIIDYPEKIIPNAPDSNASESEKLALVSFLKFASGNRGKDVGIFLVTESILDLNDQIARSSYVAQIRIDMPNAEERAAYILSLPDHNPPGSIMDTKGVAERTAGLNLLRIQNVLSQAKENNIPLTPEFIAKAKKKLIEEYCQGLVTFKEPSPKLKLSNVAGHPFAKQKLEDITWLIKNGKTNVLEKGILIPGRVGVGKSYLIDCFASECGLPSLELGNFRSKWVGDTEKQLSKVLITIRALGPIIVIVDEADAVFGSTREGGGKEDGGVSSRVFAALAAHIGESELRGKEIWIAMTSRPDLLAIDMKRSGRFGLCIPLFPTQNEEETVTMFQIVASTQGVTLGEKAIAKIKELLGKKPLTGSDVEAVLIRAKEKAILKEREEPTEEDFSQTIENFIDALDPNLLRLQELAGVLACTDKTYLPEQYKNADRAALKTEFEILAN